MFADDIALFSHNLTFRGLKEAFTDSGILLQKLILEVNAS